MSMKQTEEQSGSTRDGGVKLYQLTRDISRSDCHWLDEDFKCGDIVALYVGPTYGVISKSGRAFTKRTVENMNGVDVIMNSPFFELPQDAVKPL